MPPKKKGADEVKVRLGRPGNNVKMGIVGLPNVGKSSFFNALCKMSVPAENFPFCTIDPTVSRVEVPDERFEWLCEHWKPASKVPAFLTVTDIAGLVKGASRGEGLGNAFLSHIFAVDGIFHMVRLFDSEDITHVEGSIDPVRDIEIISSELRIKDMEKIYKELQNIENKRTKLSKEEEYQKQLYRTLIDQLEEGTDVRFGEWKATDVEYLNPLGLLTAKPLIFLLNMSKKDFIRKKNKHLAKVHKHISEKYPGSQMIPFSVELEQEFIDNETTNEQMEEFAKENNGARSQMPKIIWSGYKSLELFHYFTGGKDEVKCWTIREGTKAPQAAGVIHTDFERGFIMAEVMNFDDFKEHGSELAVKGAGKLRQQGKEYVVADGDIIHFKFNVTAKKK